MYCQNCGNNIDGNSRCPFCGQTVSDEIIGEAREIESVNIEPHTEETSNNGGFKEHRFGGARVYTYSSSSNDGGKKLPTLLKILFVILALSNTFVGYIIAITLLCLPHKSYKSFGVKLIILCIVLTVLSLIFGAMSLIFGVLWHGLHQVTGTLI